MSTRYTFKNRSFKRYYGDEAPRTGTVELTVDWDHLIETLGEKAAYNKSKRSALGVGIKVKFIPAKEAA